MRVFTVIYVLFGTSFTFYHLSGAVGSVLEAWQGFCLSLVDMFDKTTKVLKVDSTGDGKADREISVAGRSKGLSGREVDLNGDGQADCAWAPRLEAYLLHCLALLPSPLPRHPPFSTAR